MIFNMCVKDNGFSAHRSQLADVSMHSMHSPCIKLGLGLSFSHILLHLVCTTTVLNLVLNLACTQLSIVDHATAVPILSLKSMYCTVGQ